jgi:hypothetical protein
MKRIALIVASLAVPVVLALLMTLTGCGDERRGHSRETRDRSPERREPVHVAQPQPQQEYVIVREAPPPPVVERRPSAPSREYIWIDGYWNWNGDKYVWERGHWARPPRERTVWVAPRYERHERGYRYTPGQWREEQQERSRDEEHRDRQ